MESFDLSLYSLLFIHDITVMIQWLRFPQQNSGKTLRPRIQSEKSHQLPTEHIP